MKKIFKFLAILFVSACLLPACSDDNGDDPITPEETKLKDVIAELEKMPDVAAFTNALKGASTTLNIQEDKITVLAVKNFNTQRNTQAESTPDLNPLLKRHIIKGVQDLSDFTGESLQLKSIGGDDLIVTKSGNQILVNGIALANTTPTKAGESYIYVVNENIPEAKDIPQPTKYKIILNVLQCNENWSAENNQESQPAVGATVSFYEKEGEEYTLIYRIQTGEDGQVIYSHNNEGELYYQVISGLLVPEYSGYLPVGVFTSEEEIESYPQYRTETSMDYVVPGTIKLADLNGDGIINEDDKLTTNFFPVGKEAEETIYLTSNPGLVTENIIKVKDLPKISEDLDEAFTVFISKSYETNLQLITGDAGFPDLQNMYQIDHMWETGYKYINMLISVIDIIEGPGYRNYPLQEAWRNYSGKHWTQFAHVYSVLVSNFGDVVLRTKKIENISEAWDFYRSPKLDVMKFVESLIEKGAQPEAVKAMLARYLANERDYNRAYSFSKEVINSGKYQLVSGDPFATESNPEVILGGYESGNPDISKGSYMHPIRYREVILTAAEAAAGQGMLQEAVGYINQIYSAKNAGSYVGETTAEAVQTVIRDLWKEEMYNEGLDYILINRWNILIETLGEYGAETYNNLLPIPYSEIIFSPNMKQNPGY